MRRDLVEIRQRLDDALCHAAAGESGAAAEAAIKLLAGVRSLENSLGELESASDRQEVRQ